MFSVKEKQHIASVIEKTLLELNHPEMPTEKPEFTIHINGKEPWSWADIKPNWAYEDGKEKMEANLWNEISRKTLSKFVDKEEK